MARVFFFYAESLFHDKSFFHDKSLFHGKSSLEKPNDFIEDQFWSWTKYNKIYWEI